MLRKKLSSDNTNNEQIRAHKKKNLSLCFAGFVIIT